jgi:hydrogenase expression/formation protein HypE
LHHIEELLNRFGSDIKFLRDPTRGGVASVLNEIAELTNLGFLIKQHDLPMEEQVVGACEMLGLDPLYVANEGIFLAIVKPDIAEDVLQLLRQHKPCVAAANIGTVNNDNKGKVLIKSAIGGTRVVNFLTGEQLPRIC